MANKRASDSAGASRHPVTVVENPPQKTVALLLRVVSVRSTRRPRNQGGGARLDREPKAPSTPCQFPAKKIRGVPQKWLQKFRARVCFAKSG